MIRKGSAWALRALASVTLIAATMAWMALASAADAGRKDPIGTTKRGSVEWQAFMGTADDSAREGDSELALAGYRRALEFAKENWQFAITYMRLGQGELARGNLPDAIRDLETARDYAAKDKNEAVPQSDLLAALIEAYSRAGEDMKAVETAIALKAVDPGHPAVLGIAMGAPMAKTPAAPPAADVAPADAPSPTPQPAAKPAPRSATAPSAEVPAKSKTAPSATAP